MLFSIEECMKQERSTLDQLYSEYQLLETNKKEGKSYFITQRLFDTLVREEEILYPLYKINSPNKKNQIRIIQKENENIKTQILDLRKNNITDTDYDMKLKNIMDAVKKHEKNETYLDMIEKHINQKTIFMLGSNYKKGALFLHLCKNVEEYAFFFGQS